MQFVRRLARFVFSWRGLVLLVAVAALFIWLSLPDDRNIEAFARNYDTTAAPVDLIPPGTVIGETAPQGWSRLVVKSLPRVAPEHRDKVSSLMVRKAVRYSARARTHRASRPGAAEWCSHDPPAPGPPRQYRHR